MIVVLGFTIAIAIFATLVAIMAVLIHFDRRMKDQTDAARDLIFTLNQCIDEVRSVQTYGLRLQK